MKKTNKFFTIIASLIYIFSISYFAYNLTKEYISGPVHTKAVFDTSISAIKTELPGKIPGTNIFSDSINKCFPDLNAFSYIEVFINGDTVYKYQVNELETSDESRLIKPYFTSFKIQDDNYFVSANLYKLKPYTIYYNARISFLIILIVTITTIILIIMLSNNSQNSSTSKEELISEEDEELEDNAFIVENEESDVIESEEENINIVAEPENKIEESSDETNKEPELIEQDGIEFIQLPEEADTEIKDLPVLPTEEIKPVTLSEEVPEGLFSPTTGLGWEQYLLTRLDSEISRAISSEFDLSLFIIKITNISRGSDTVKKVCEHLINIFQFKDLLFEYKEDCIVAIKISMNIDEAITLADTIYTEITEILKDSFAKCYIGISSKTIRMISGERLLREANEALAHAEGTPDSPIMGFRADAEKFRKYFENQ